MATSFEIRDPMLTQALLTHFVQQIKFSPSGFDQLSDAGMCTDLVDHLKSRATVAELCRVAASSQPRFTVSFDDRTLLADFFRSSRVIRDDQVKEYLSLAGTSSELMCRWFSVSRPEAESLRASLMPQRTARLGGRPKLPDLKTRDAIHRAWLAMPTDLPEREAYYELHLQFTEYTVTALYQVVHEMDVPVPSPRYSNTDTNGSAIGPSAAKEHS